MKKTDSIKIGDLVEVYIERIEISMEIQFSAEKKLEEKKLGLKKFHKDEKIVTGIILGRVKGGFTVDIDGATFLPGSQVDIKPIKDFHSIMNIPQKFQILKWIKKEVTLLYPKSSFRRK